MSPGLRPAGWAGAAFGRYKPLRFAVVGVLNTAASTGLYAVLVYCGLSVALASLLALIAGIAFSFTTQSRVVFRHASAATFVRYVVAWSVIYLLNLAIIEAFIHLQFGAYLAGAAASIPVAVISYFVLDLLVFRNRRAGGRPT